MSWSWLLSLIWKVVGLFGAGKGTRITFEAQPEASIEAEWKKIEELKKRCQEKKDELDRVTKRIVDAKALGCVALADKLDGRRQQLRHEYHHLRQQLLDAQRCSFEGR
jgi:hypothetical protein